MYRINDYIPGCKNFQFKEFFRSENDFKKADKKIIKNIILLASALQRLRDELGIPINITSAYRDPIHNKLVGGSPNSWHLYGLAVDCWFSGLNWDKSRLIFAKKFFYGVIFYPNKKVVHLDLRYTDPYLSINYSK